MEQLPLASSSKASPCFLLLIRELIVVDPSLYFQLVSRVQNLLEVYNFLLGTEYVFCLFKQGVSLVLGYFKRTSHT